MPHRFLTFTLAVSISLIINIYSLKSYVHHFLSAGEKIKVKTELPMELISMPRSKNKFIDTRTDKNREKVDSDLISENSSRTDSKKQGDIKSSMPDADIKGLLPQARRISAPLNKNRSMEAIKQELKEIQKKEQEAQKKRELENKVSLVKKKGLKKAEEKGQDKRDKKETNEKQNLQRETEKKLNEIKELDTNLTAQASGESLPVDLFPLPMISMGEHSVTDAGVDSFKAQGSDLGAYLKSLREKVGLNFHQMVIFHYKTNYIFESRTRVEFSIAKDGSLKGLETFFIEGDPMFPEYCKSVVNASAPFKIIPDNINHYLEEDNTLKIKFMFGYNIKESAGN